MVLRFCVQHRLKSVENDTRNIRSVALSTPKGTECAIEMKRERERARKRERGKSGMSKGLTQQAKTKCNTSSSTKSIDCDLGCATATTVEMEKHKKIALKNGLKSQTTTIQLNRFSQFLG